MDAPKLPKRPSSREALDELVHEIISRTLTHKRISKVDPAYFEEMQAHFALEMKRFSALNVKAAKDGSADLIQEAQNLYRRLRIMDSLLELMR